jgi:hypothetical protein
VTWERSGPCHDAPDPPATILSLSF